MTVPCEFVVKSVLPAIRALIAKELRHTHFMKQVQIASLLGVTQSAVSQYLRSYRGKAINIEDLVEIRDIVRTIAIGLANTLLTRRQVVQNYCKACQIIREKRLLCTLHKRIDPTYNVDACDVCMSVQCSL
jgi:predicted transcriptional regulator